MHVVEVKFTRSLTCETNYLTMKKNLALTQLYFTIEYGIILIFHVFFWKEY